MKTFAIAGMNNEYHQGGKNGKVRSSCAASPLLVTRASSPGRTARITHGMSRRKDPATEHESGAAAHQPRVLDLKAAATGEDAGGAGMVRSWRRSGADHYIFGKCSGRRNGQAILDESFNMHLNGLIHIPLGLISRAARGDAPGQVRRVCRVILAGIFDNDEKSVHVHFRPACLRMLLNVPGARSSPGFPAMVTRPGFVGCLY